MQKKRPKKKEKHAEGKAHAELAALKTKLEQAEKKLAETKDTLLRTAAEYDNFRKRSAREKDAAFGNGVASR
ncbi:MAG: nucleotide exchange factor GrpE [Ruthenibacterium lactatiformans]